MTQAQLFNHRQREMFVNVLTEARQRKEAELENEDGEKHAETEFIEKLAEERGAVLLIEKVRSLRQEVQAAEDALGKLGFDCDEDGLSLKWKAPRDVRKALEDLKRSARVARQTALKAYDRAVLEVWTAPDVQAAKAVVEALL